MPDLAANYETLIAELDKTLSMVRGFWIEARDDNERRKSMARIDQLLDERWRLMRARDAAKGMAPPQPEAGLASAFPAKVVKSVKVKGRKPDAGPL